MLVGFPKKEIDRLVVVVSGIPGTGKSSFCQFLSSLVPSSSYIDIDDLEDKAQVVDLVKSRMKAKDKVIFVAWQYGYDISRLKRLVEITDYKLQTLELKISSTTNEFKQRLSTRGQKWLDKYNSYVTDSILENNLF